MRTRVIILLLAVVGVLTANQLAAQSVQYTDTSLMLNKYLRKTDTTFMLSRYLRKTDTSNLVNRYLRKSDTASMLLPYLRKGSSGTLNFVPKLTSLNTIGNSQLFDNGTNVGIGTASPVAKLDVVGNAKFSGSLTTLGDIFITGTAKALVFNSAVNFNTQIYELSNSLILRTGGTDRMRLDASGNVGIGNASPAEKLDIGGNGAKFRMTTASDPFYRFSIQNNWDASNTINFYGTGDLNFLKWIYNTNSLILQPNSGNTLIGTTTDNVLDKLQVNGSGKFSNNLTANNFIKAGGTSSQYLMADGSISTLPSFMGGSGTLNYIPKLTASNSIGNSQIFDNGSNVGIGTTSPSYKTEISSNIGNYWNGSAFTGTPLALSISNTQPGGYDPVLLLQQAESGGAIRNSGAIGMVGTGPWTTGNNSIQTSDMYFLVRNNVGSISERMRITSAGNIGIGTISPAYKLDVRNDVAAPTSLDPISLGLYNNSDGGSAIYFRNGVGGKSKLSFGVESAGAGTDDTYLGFSTGANTTLTERLRIASSGNVGIGTTNPSEKIDIGGNGAKFRMTTASDPFYRFSIQNNYDASNTINFYGTGDLNFLKWIYNTNSLILQPNSGNTLIGTTSDNGLDKLQVNGSGKFLNNLTANGFIKAGGTSSQFLMADGSTSTLPSFMGGSGTLNYIPKLTGTNSIGNSQIFDNGTNIGIGTTSPGGFYKLDVFGNSRTSGYFSFNDKGYIRGGTSTNTLDLQSGTAGIFFMNSSYSVLNAALLDNGNFGIGTASPIYKLEVNGTGLFSGDALNVYGTGDMQIGRDITYSTPYMAVGFGGRGNANNKIFAARDNTDGLFLNAATGRGIAMVVNGGTITAMNITSAGNIGIGSASPDAKLRIAGTYNGTQAIFGNTDGRGLLLGTASNGTNEAISILNARGTGAGMLQFQTDGIDRVRIGNTGNVMINSINDNGVDKLQVAGSANIIATDNTGTRQNPINTLTLTGENPNAPYNGFGASLLFNNRAYTSGIVNSARIRSQINNNSIGNNGGSMVFEVTPNVGGTLTPALTLDYNGTALFNNSVTANSFVKAGGTNTQFLMADGSTSTLGSILSGSGTSGYLTKWTSATSQANSVIYDNGTNVGIGTQTPDNAQGWNRVLNLHGPNHAKFLVTESSGVKVGIFSHTDYNGKIGTESNHNLTFTAGYWNDVMTLTTAGNVGIGTLNPSGQFETYTDGYRRFSVYYPSAFETKLSIGANAYINQHANNEELSISQQYGTGKITFYTGYPNYERMRITSDGNVGIGTANPAAKLDVVGAMGIRVNEDGIGTKIISIRSDFAGVDPAINVSTNNSLLLQTNNIERMRITSDGNVGIGTTAPGPYKLAVEGTIGARKMKITQQGIPWADYVFQDDYQLRSLEALDKYIQQYKHLPEVPTTKEVNENGLDVADTQALLLKKIEELTLYMIELKKENDQLKAHNSKIETKINNIEKGLRARK